MAHDFGHFLIPDLIYTGLRHPLVRKTYIIYRMMSEATTLVFADMLFVDTLKRCNTYEYNWSKRKIHPLLVATGLDPFRSTNGQDQVQTFFQDFKLLLQANVQYCLLGDDSTYMNLIQQAGVVPVYTHEKTGKVTCDAMEQFKAKYMPFFVEDYNWTECNFNNMREHADDYKHWWQVVRPLAKAAGVVGDGGRSTGGRNTGGRNTGGRNTGGRNTGARNTGARNTGEAQSISVGLETVEEHLLALGIDVSSNAFSEPTTTALIQMVFHRMFATRIRPIFDRPPGQRVQLASPDERRTQSFVRYLLGQSVIFSRYSFVPESDTYQSLVVGKTIQRLQTGNGLLTMDHVRNARSAYSQFVRLLFEKALITSDDMVNYCEVCPLFKPSYVSYDKDETLYEQLADVQKRILDGGGDGGGRGRAVGRGGRGVIMVAATTFVAVSSVVSSLCE